MQKLMIPEFPLINGSLIHYHVWAVANDHPALKQAYSAHTGNRLKMITYFEEMDLMKIQCGIMIVIILIGFLQFGLRTLSLDHYRDQTNDTRMRNWSTQTRDLMLGNNLQQFWLQIFCLVLLHIKERHLHLHFKEGSLHCSTRFSIP